MSSICVACRFRPQSEAELAGGARACVWREQSAERGPEVLVAAREGKAGPGGLRAPDGAGSERRGASGELAFAFDHVFAPDASQRDVFDAAVAPLCRDVLRGYNCTVLAYGQTGSGKTHTMSGERGGDDPEQRGVLPRVAEALFEGLPPSDDGAAAAPAAASPAPPAWDVRVACVEIYMERIVDLLKSPAQLRREEAMEFPPAPLRVRENERGEISLEGATEEGPLRSARELEAAVARADARRAVGATQMNARSSRSHQVTVVTVRRREGAGGDAGGDDDADAGGGAGGGGESGGGGGGVTRVGKLHLVDLAGSEAVRKTGATGATLQEARHINKSLSALANVIGALTQARAPRGPPRAPRRRASP